MSNFARSRIIIRANFFHPFYLFFSYPFLTVSRATKEECRRDEKKKSATAGWKEYATSLCNSNWHLFSWGWPKRFNKAKSLAWISKVSVQVTKRPSLLLQTVFFPCFLPYLKVLVDRGKEEEKEERKGKRARSRCRCKEWRGFNILKCLKR